jgi:DNA-binding MarR family transcriptional regulator
VAVTLTTDQALDILSRAIRGLVRDDLRDLTQRQLAVLTLVYRAQAPETVRGLAAELGIGKPAITRAVDRLEGLELVRRMVDIRDKRSVLIGRTVAGAVYLRDLSERVVIAAAAAR